MKTAIFALAATLLSGAALAGDGYFGLAGGATKQNFDCTGSTSCDTSGKGAKVYGGYKFTPQFAVEAGYTSFGKVEAKVYAVNVEYATSAVFASGVVFVPLGSEFELVGRLGIASVKAKPSASLFSASFSDSETKANPYFGLELGYAIASDVKLTAGADFSKSKYKSETTNAALYSVGLRLEF